MVDAYVNWNPDPQVHAFGERRQQRVVALCGVIVREQRGEFDPADPKTCEWCAKGVEFGFDVGGTRALRALAVDPGRTIVCKRPSQ